MTDARSASEADYFPYGSKRICLLEIHGGQVTQLRYRDEKIEAVSRARRRRKPSIFAVWPGEYRSDLFVIEDLDRLLESI